MNRASQKVLWTLKTVLPSHEWDAFSSWCSTFYPFQQDWLLEPARFAVCNKSRQIGLSHTTAAWAVYRGAFLGETTTIISVGEREALEVLDKAKKHARVLSQLGSQWSYHEARSEDIRFRSGGRIIALPASSGGRSYSGNVVLDEFAYHGLKSDKVWDGAAAVVMHQYALRVLSTPNGVGNAFHHLWTEDQANKGYAKHQITVHQAMQEGMDIRLDDCWKMAKGDPRIFGQLFECSFLDGEEQYIPTSAILSACLDQGPFAEQVLALPPYAPTYAGLDIGLTHDLSSLVILKQAPDNTVFVVDVEAWKRTEWEEQMKRIELSARKWNWQRLCVDSTGIGAVPAKLLQHKFGRMRVEPIAFTSPNKEELATSMYQVFSDTMIRMPRDYVLIKELCSIKRIITSTKQVRYDAERTANGHADRAWALALAIQACSNKPCSRVELPSRFQI